MRWLRVAGIGLGVVVLLLLLLVGGMVFTAPGARFVLDRALPAGAEIGDVDGSLWGPLVLEDVRYEGPGLEARVARVRVDWRPTRLLRRTLAITTLEVDTVDVRLRAGEAPGEEEAGGLARPSVPLAVYLEEGLGRQISVVTAGGDTVRTRTVLLAGSARRDTFELDSLRLRDFDYRGGRVQVDAGGKLVTGASGAPDSAGLELEWTGRLADGRRVAGRGTIQGAEGALAVDQRLTAPVAAALEARVQVPWAPDTLRWSATLEVPRVDLAEIRDGVEGELELSAEGSGGPVSGQGRVTARGSHPELGPLALDGRVRYRGDTLTLDTLRLRAESGPGSVTASGTVGLGEGGPAIDARLGWDDLGWPLDTASIASPSGSLAIVGRPADFQADGQLSLRRPGQPLGRWAVRARGGYAESRLRLPELVARRDGGGRVTATADVALADGPRGQATVEWSGLTWPPTRGDTTRVASRDGRIRVEGAMDDFTVAADLSLSGPAVPVNRVRLDLRGDADGDRVRARLGATGTANDTTVLELDGEASYRLADGLLVVDTLDARLPGTGGSLTLRGEVDLADPEGRLAVRARWRDLVWPVQGPRYRSDEGRVDVTGDGRLRVSASAHLGGLTLPEGRWRLAGQGGLDRFAVDSLVGATLGGEVRVTGVVWPDSGPAWDLQVVGDTLDPGVWREAWNGRVGFRLQADGRLEEAGPRFRTVLDSVTGQVRERPVSARFVAEGSGGRMTVDTLWLRSGGSTLQAAGTVGDALDVEWRLAAETLYDFVPGAVGVLEAEGRVTGPRDGPTVSLTAGGRGLTVAGWTADTLAATAELARGGRDSSTIAVTLLGLQGDLVAVDSMRLTVGGTRADHAVSVSARSPDDELEGRLTGALEDDGWTGRLHRFRLRSALAGEWRLRDPARLAVAADSGALDRVCWVGSGELCLAASWDAGGVRWDGTGQALPMAFLRPALPQGLQLRGEFALETRGRTGAGAVPTGMLRLTGGPGEVDYVPDLGRTVTQPYDTIAVEATSDSTGIDGRAALRLGALGELRASASLPGTGPIRGRGLSGELRLHLEDDSTVSRLVPALTESRGTADIQVELAGSVAAPEVRGRVSIQDVGAGVPSAGIRLSDGRLTAASTDNGRWEIEGGVTSDTSRLAIRGFARPPRGDSVWLASLTVEGQTFPTVQTPELTVVTSPRLEVRASPDSVTVDGRLGVPRARIAVRGLEGTAEVSPDVVIIGGEAAEPDRMMTPAAVRAEVELVLGNDVHIDAFGLDGRLDGQLTIVARPDRPPVGNGELEIVDGQYEIYRQTFQIDQGQLLFASTPLTDPGLDLRITRQAGQVTAGMNITGRASDPRVQLFSDPSLADEQILAYLIAGRPLRSLSQTEGSRVQSMARSVGVAGGNLLLARLGSAFGLETARIEQTDPDEVGQEQQTRLVLGSEILPRVHVDYAIGWKDAANIIRLRYMITDHWIFQTESGEETGADLLYTFGSPIPRVADGVPTESPRE